MNNTQQPRGISAGKDSFSDTSTGRIFEAYMREIDAELLDIGWGFVPAKSVEYGKIDQPMVNHVRNGVFAFGQLNEIIPGLGGRELDEKQLRRVVALFVMHDLHKLRGEQAREDEYEIEQSEVRPLVERLELQSFSKVDSDDEPLTMADFHACAVDHEDSERSKPGHSQLTYDRLRPFVRLADAFASSDSPEAAVEQRNRDALTRAYPELPDLTLRYHALDDVKGVFTNLLNGVISKTLCEEYDYRLLAIYQDGCVYVTTNGDEVALDDEFVETLYETLKDDINDSHDAYQNEVKLAENLSTRGPKGRYAVNEQDLFYAGTGAVLSAIVVKATQDADPEADPTESMAETMDALSEFLPFDINSENRVAAGYARLAHTVKRAFVDPVVSVSESSDDALVGTCDVFGLPEAATNALVEVREESDLNPTAGGKWDYGYAIGQHVADRVQSEALQPGDIAREVLVGLTALDEDWPEIVMEAHTGRLGDELRTYIADVVRVEGGSLPPTETKPADVFDEHHSKRRGKTCTFCNRGTTSTRKSDMETPKSLTTFQSGYSNRIPADSGKPDKLLVCVPCQVEFSLRETGSQWRDADRLFVHLVPDYFYTPQMWNLYSDEIFHRFSGEEMTRLGRLASAMFRVANRDEGRFENVKEYVPIENDDPERAESFAEILNEATTTEGGRQMIEELSQGFDPDAGFGAQTLSFHKPQDNEIEFQFFGVFLGLSVASAMGLRAYVSQSPMPDIRGRDFPQMAKIGAGFSRVTDFYGDEIPLSALRERLGAAAALIRLGYERKQEDSLFAKYLRVTRNELLPGAYLLKRAVQASDDGDNARFVLEEADFLDTYSGTTVTNNHRHDDNTMTSDTNKQISTLADYAFDAIRPVGGNSKPYAIERVFRESVKAVKEANSLDIDERNAIDRITGRLQKLPDRSDQVYRVSGEKSKRGGTPDERIEMYAEQFVNGLLKPKYEMKPSLLKRDANNLADGFYAATLRLQRELWNDESEE